ncbi:MAG: response regulator transcription factor [Sandaracinaceae bacterium]|nr:response regulator transcription factor [Sandaracinaceae bacterium]
MRLLLVEDEDRLAQVLARALSEDGFMVDTCSNGADAFEQALRVKYDAVVLDWVLPQLDGVEVLRRWRARGMNTPVLLLSARGSVGERVQGLRAGADDYVVKPVALEELHARVAALVRRGRSTQESKVGDVNLDVRARTLTGPRAEENLSGRECATLALLISNLNDVVARSEILSHVWGSDFDGTPNVVDVYIGYLRTKLARVGAEDVALETVRGIGFRLKAKKQA